MSAMPYKYAHTCANENEHNDDDDEKKTDEKIWMEKFPGKIARSYKYETTQKNKTVCASS